MCWNEFVEEIVSPWDLIIMTPKIVTTLWPQNFIITTQCWTAILWNSHCAKNTWWPQNFSQWIWDIQLPGVQGKIKGGLRAVIYGQGHGKHKLRLWWWEPIPCYQPEKAFHFFFQVFNSVGQLYYGLDKHIEHMCDQLIIAYTNHDRNWEKIYKVDTLEIGLKLVLQGFTIIQNFKLSNKKFPVSSLCKWLLYISLDF